MRASLALILALYLVAATLFALRTPRWQAPDEPAHYNYVVSIAERGELPLLTLDCYPADYLEQLKSRRFPPEMPTGGLCYEAHQPPLYYLLAAPIARFATALGLDTLIALRLFSVVLGAGVVLASAGLVRELFPDCPLLAVGVAGLVATVPMHLTFLSAVNNDALAEFLLVLSVWQMLRLLRQPDRRRGWVILGVLLGLDLLTKTTAYIALPLAALTVLLAGGGRRPARWQVARAAGLAFGLALLFILPWFTRNSLAYGGFDILGLERHDEVVVGQLRTEERLAEQGAKRYLRDFALTTFHSFWGQFGWMAAPLPGWVYNLLWVWTIGGSSGFALFLIRAFRAARRSCKALLTPRQWRGVALLAAWVVFNLAIYVWYNLSFVQFQGRYLFPSLTAIATLLVLGGSEWIADRYHGLGLSVTLAGFWLLDLWSLFTIIVPQLSP